MPKVNLLTWLLVNQGASLDLDGAYGPQCMDLVNAWMRINGKADLPGNAVDVPAARRGDLAWTRNGPVNFPLSGDVVCFAPSNRAIGTGPYAHVAIAVIGNSMAVLTADQNWAGEQKVTLNMHPYTGVLGWFHLA